MSTLFKLGEQQLALYAQLDEGGELTEELDRQFATLQTAEAEKLDNYLFLMSQLEMEERAAKETAAYWTKRAKVRSNLYESLKDRLKQYLEFTKRDEARTASGRVIALQSTGKPGLVVDEGVDPLDQPDEVTTYVPPTEGMHVIDKAKVLTFLKAGGKLTWARLTEPTKFLKIK